MGFREIGDIALYCFVGVFALAFIIYVIGSARMRRDHERKP